jgi:hypothetical protein
MKPRPKPLLGLVLGLLFGAVVVTQLWQLGVAPPDRFILFGIVAVSIALTELLLTQTTRRGKKRFVTVMVVAGLFGGVALTGVPETFSGSGSLSDGCHLEITSGTETVVPEDTEPFDPLDTTPTDTLTWTSSTDEVLTNWDTSLGMLIGGIPVELFTAERDNAEQSTEWFGEESVADYLAEIEDQTGLELRGTFHIAAAIDADEGDCDMGGYIRVNAENPFATPLIIGLWALGAVLLVMIIWIASSVGRSVRDAKAAAYLPTTSADVPPASEQPLEAAESVGAFTPPSQPDAAAQEAVIEPETVVKKEESVTEKPVIAERTVYADAPADAGEAVEPEAVEPEIVEPEPVELEFVEPEAVEPEFVEPEITAGEPEPRPDYESSEEITDAGATEPTEPRLDVTEGEEPTAASGSDEEPTKP